MLNSENVLSQSHEQSRAGGRGDVIGSAGADEDHFGESQWEEDSLVERSNAISLPSAEDETVSHPVRAAKMPALRIGR